MDEIKKEALTQGQVFVAVLAANAVGVAMAVGVFIFRDLARWAWTASENTGKALQLEKQILATVARVVRIVHLNWAGVQAGPNNNPQAIPGNQNPFDLNALVLPDERKAFFWLREHSIMLEKVEGCDNMEFRNALADALLRLV